MTSEDDRTHEADPRGEAYLAAVKRSEEVRRDAYTSADQLAIDAIEDAGGKLSHPRGGPSRGRRTSTDLATHGRVTAAAGDARAGLYREAEERHFDRRAALAVHFGQRWTGRGNAGADHARQFVAEVDPDGLYRADPEPSPIGSPVMAEHHPGMPVLRRIDERGIIVAETFTPGDGGRGTFRGDAAAARRFATMTQRERAEAAAWVAEQAQSVSVTSPAVTETPAPELAVTTATPDEPPPGLVADIQAALARTTR
jgi:hypothetical protein